MGRKPKLTPDDQELVRELYGKPGYSAPVLGRMFRVSSGTILRIVSTMPMTLSRQERVTIGRLIDEAKRLKSEHGENPEYDRALIELVTFVSGGTTENLSTVAAALGIKRGK